MTKFVVNQKVQVIVSGEITTVSGVNFTENGVRYTLQGRPLDVLYHGDMLDDPVEIARKKSKDELREQRRQEEHAKRLAEARRQADLAHVTDNGSAMIAASVYLNQVIEDESEPTRSSDTSYSSYSSSSSYSSYDSSSYDSGSSCSSSSSSCD